MKEVGFREAGVLLTTMSLESMRGVAVDGKPRTMPGTAALCAVAVAVFAFAAAGAAAAESAPALVGLDHRSSVPFAAGLERLDWERPVTAAQRGCSMQPKGYFGC